MRTSEILITLLVLEKTYSTFKETNSNLQVIYSKSEYLKHEGQYSNKVKKII